MNKDIKNEFAQRNKNEQIQKEMREDKESREEQKGGEVLFSMRPPTVIVSVRQSGGQVMSSAATC